MKTIISIMIGLMSLSLSAQKTKVFVYNSFKSVDQVRSEFNYELNNSSYFIEIYINKRYITDGFSNYTIIRVINDHSYYVSRDNQDCGIIDITSTRAVYETDDHRKSYIFTIKNNEE